MLLEALKAKIPAIHVATDDPQNVYLTLEYLGGTSFLSLDEGNLLNFSDKAVYKQSTYFFTTCDEAPEVVQAVYDTAIKHNKCVVFVNTELHHLMFETGELNLPPEVVRTAVGWFATDANVEPISQVLMGYSIQQIENICRIASVKFHKLYASTVSEIKRGFQPTIRGLSSVPCETNYYRQPKLVKDWLAVDGKLFVHPDTPQIILPRGLLFRGATGTGKTMAVKNIASKLKIPLIRMDIPSVLDKWMGNAEAHYMAALQRVEEQAPCILLYDEVEKLFSMEDESGVMPRILSMTLWWLQEHRSKVLTCMTCNNDMKIPQELLRPGRIDTVFELDSVVTQKEIRLLTRGYIKSVQEECKLSDPEVARLIDATCEAVVGSYLSHASVIAAANKEIKSYLVVTI